MLTQITTAAIAALTAAAPVGAERDTTFTAPEGMRLEVENRAGTIDVRGIDGGRVRIELRNGPRRALRVRTRGSVVGVGISERWRDDAEDEEIGVRLEVPREATLRLRGTETAIRVEGVAGAVEAESVDGDVAVRGPAASVRARSVDGDLVVEGARGSVDLYTADGDVRLTDVEGQVRAESIDGDLSLRRVSSARVDASTTDGDVLFDGAFRPGGAYRLSTHDGDIRVTVPEGTSAVFDVNAPSRGVDAGFGLPTAASDGRGRHLRFVLGDGSARVELSSFDGKVVLRRPGGLSQGGSRDGDGRDR